ncbi:hypothetical protein BamIOP4010DRAFT_6725 [Burkholderia ambifaria IOP40-10]|uniref:Uncharacterized protein n=1 Tax=Burkholderia ambifaria IOP40-10 TaxID=396596 RepID=B1FRR2_9BURK|nr:hypothetical protein BamIOP4010DRAFT_6725 [Burkholderia ambifaria IOP40-10]
MRERPLAGPGEPREHVRQRRPLRSIVERVDRRREEREPRIDPAAVAHDARAAPHHVAVIRIEGRPDADLLRLERGECVDRQHEAHVDVARCEAVFAQRAVQLVLRDAAARRRHDDGAPLQVGDRAHRRIGLHDDAERRWRAHARRDDPQRRIAERGRQHGQVAGWREIDRARALRFEQRRGTLEIRPAKPVRHAVEHARGLGQRTQAAGLIAEHQRDVRQVGAGRAGGQCGGARKRCGGQGGHTQQRAAAGRGGGRSHRRRVLGDPRAGRTAAGQITESVSRRQTSNRAMLIRERGNGGEGRSRASLPQGRCAGTHVPRAPSRSAGARARVRT